jgi:hypothetical protein
MLKKRKHKPMSENLRSNLRFVLWIVLAVAVVVFLVLWIVLHKSAAPQSRQMPAPNPVAVVPANQLPSSFPVNVPMEAGASVASNFNSSAANGQIQATRSFESKKSVDANFAIYDSFLSSKTGGWTIVSEENASGSSSKSILARGNGGWITVTLNSLPPPPIPASLVNITYVTNPTPTVAAQPVKK